MARRWELGRRSWLPQVVPRLSAGGEGDGRWVWTMNGMPHNARVDRLGFTDTLEEAKQAASDAFDEWRKKAGLMIGPASSE